MREDERFDPSRHSLADAAERLKQISEKDYSRRLAEVMGRYEEENTDELAAGGVIEPGGIAMVADGAGSPEIVYTPKDAQVIPKLGFWDGLSESIKTLKAEQERIDRDRIRALVREELHHELYPTAEMANVHEHMRVEMTTEKGRRWRGVLYPMERTDG